MRPTSLQFQCRAVTDIWTAGGGGTNDRLRMTGLLGGIRWWCEAIVRGLGVRACDPVSNRCTGTQGCMICKLFGRADPPQAAKFAVRAWTSPDRRTPFTGPLTAGTNFVLEFYCYRDLTPAEEYLLVKAMDIISRYGSVGGKTTLKPARAALHPPLRHADRGLLRLTSINGQPPNRWRARGAQFALDMQAAAITDRVTGSLPTLANFWFLPGRAFYIHPTVPGGNDSINNLLGLDDTLAARQDLTPKTWGDGRDPLRAHLRGIPENSAFGNPASKKVFSFAAPARTWGYVLDPSLLPQLPGLLVSAGLAGAPPIYGNAVLAEPIG